MHTGEKPYSYPQSFDPSRHIKTAAHIRKMKCKNTKIPLTKSSFVDCGEAIKEEDIKEEIKEEESVEDPLTINQEFENSNICEDIKKEIKKEKNIEVPSINQQEIGDVSCFFLHGIKSKIVKDLSNSKASNLIL